MSSKQPRELEELATDSVIELPREASVIHTPLKPKAWQRLLRNHPDKWFADYIQEGHRAGVPNGEQANLISHMKNMLSAAVHTGVVDDYLGREVERKS